MPEITEVERIKDDLKSIIGFGDHHIIHLSDVGFVNIKQNQNKEPVYISYLKRNIKDISRHGKYLFIELESITEEVLEGLIVVHLGMSGLLNVVDDLKNLNNKAFNNLSMFVKFCKTWKYHYLAFSGIRFSRYWYYQFHNKKDFIKEKNLGADAINEQHLFEEQLEKYKKSTKNIYSILLDQTIICGLGNWMANEILARMKCHPQTEFNKAIKIYGVKEISENIKQVVKLGLELGGLTFSTYLTPLEEKGKVKDSLIAYNQEGKECSNYGCNEKIIKIKVNNRTCYICPKCQKVITNIKIMNLNDDEPKLSALEYLKNKRRETNV